MVNIFTKNASTLLIAGFIVTTTGILNTASASVSFKGAHPTQSHVAYEQDKSKHASQPAAISNKVVENRKMPNHRNRLSNNKNRSNEVQHSRLDGSSVASMDLHPTNNRSTHNPYPHYKR